MEGPGWERGRGNGGGISSGISVSKTLQQRYAFVLDRTTIYLKTRWAVLTVLIGLLCLRVILAQGYYISLYAFGVHLLSLFIAFLTPQSDSETNLYILPMTGQEHSGEFRPFLRKLSEFKFWHRSTLAVVAALITTTTRIFDLPVFWPILVLYFIILLIVTMKHQIKDMLKHGYFPLDLGKRRYGDVSRSSRRL